MGVALPLLYPMSRGKIAITLPSASLLNAHAQDAGAVRLPAPRQFSNLLLQCRREAGGHICFNQPGGFRSWRISGRIYWRWRRGSLRRLPGGERHQARKAYAIIMHHLDPEGKTKIYWILYNISPRSPIWKRTAGASARPGWIGISDRVGYAPPHSKGPGPKMYRHYNLRALQFSGNPGSGGVQCRTLFDAMKNSILATADFRVIYSAREPPPMIVLLPASATRMGRRSINPRRTSARFASQIGNTQANELRPQSNKQT